MRKYVLFLLLLLTLDILAQSNQSLVKKVVALLNSVIQENDETNDCIAIMDVSTGKLVVSIGNIEERQPTKLFTPIALLACMESGQIKVTDTIDTEEGIYINGTDTIKDHNWRRGGYGVISVADGIVRCSNITTRKMIEKSFRQQLDYQLQLERMDIHGIENIDNLYYGASPLQILALYNMIANNKIKADFDNVKAVRQVLRNNVVEGLGRFAASKQVEIAGYERMFVRLDSINRADFCGYFPADNPKYTAIVSLEGRDGLELKRSCGSLFREIAELLIK